jgi:hypothetical protein
MRDDFGLSPVMAFDYIYAFFQNCYHLRDWLKNSAAVSEEALRHFMSGNVEMGICRDIANGTKHLRIHSPSIDANPSIGREYHPPGWPGKRPGTTESYFILIEQAGAGQEVRYDLVDLADRCVTHWTAFLKQEGLLDHEPV